MMWLDNKDIDTYANGMNQILQECAEEQFNEFYFLVKQNDLVVNDTKKRDHNDDTHPKINNNASISTKEKHSMVKINFRQNLLMETKKDNVENEEKLFNSIFNNSQIIEKKKQKEEEEREFLKKIGSNKNLSDEEMLNKIKVLLKWNDEQFIKEKHFPSFHKYFSFYDDMFCENYVIKDNEFDYYVSMQLNGLTILSLSKYSNIFYEILTDLKNSNPEVNNLQTLLKEHIQIEYDQRLLNADVSGKRKRKTIFINENMQILRIVYKQSVYKVHSKIKGLLCDINENIISNPLLLFTNTHDGWIIILKNVKKKEKQFMPSHEYKKTKEEFINTNYKELINNFSF